MLTKFKPQPYPPKRARCLQLLLQHSCSNPKPLLIIVPKWICKRQKYHSESYRARESRLPSPTASLMFKVYNHLTIVLLALQVAITAPPSRPTLVPLTKIQWLVYLVEAKFKMARFWLILRWINKEISGAIFRVKCNQICNNLAKSTTKTTLVLQRSECSTFISAIIKMLSSTKTTVTSLSSKTRQQSILIRF